MSDSESPHPIVCGIVLHPAGHTLSPILHRTAYEELGIDACYHAFDVPREAAADAVRGMRALGIRQLSVSIPLKEEVLAFADRVSTHARRIGAANTLTREGDEIVADNTDWIGVVRTLESLGSWRDRAALVVGAGGAARAVVYALHELGARVTVANRSAERAERLVRDLGGHVGTLDEPWDLLVNTTPIGMYPAVDATPVPVDRLRSGSTVFDTVYRPLETRLLREARAHGCRTQDGLDMLVHQAVAQIHLWTGRTPDAARMRRAALRVLEASPVATPRRSA